VLDQAGCMSAFYCTFSTDYRIVSYRILQFVQAGNIL